MAKNHKEGSNSKDEIENVRVVIRVRPLGKKEKAEGCRNIVTIDGQENVINLTKNDSNNEKSKTFKFDHIFPEDSSQVTFIKLNLQVSTTLALFLNRFLQIDS